MVDLHTHSSSSDGSHSPGELAALAAERGLRVWALTDHDTDAGLAEAGSASAGLGIGFVPGIELNVEWKPGEFHLLGLGLSSASPLLRACIDRAQSDRRTRNLDIIEQMRLDGMDISLEALEAANPGAVLGRPHIADFLVQKKIVKNRQQAFDRYLAQGRPYYRSCAGTALSEAIAAVRESGGLPVLAHPLSLYVSWGRLDELFADFKTLGIAGIEAWHPGARAVEAARLESLARKHGFFVTAGSDFHGLTVRPDRALGKTAGGIRIEDRFWLDELAPRLTGEGFIPPKTPL